MKDLWVISQWSKTLRSNKQVALNFEKLAGLKLKWMYQKVSRGTGVLAEFKELEREKKRKEWTEAHKRWLFVLKQGETQLKTEKKGLQNGKKWSYWKPDYELWEQDSGWLHKAWGPERWEDFWEGERISFLWDLSEGPEIEYRNSVIFFLSFSYWLEINCWFTLFCIFIIFAEKGTSINFG